MLVIEVMRASRSMMRLNGHVTGSLVRSVGLRHVRCPVLQMKRELMLVRHGAVRDARANFKVSPHLRIREPASCI